jgi:hypothetical protein
MVGRVIVTDSAGREVAVADRAALTREAAP